MAFHVGSVRTASLCYNKLFISEIHKNVSNGVHTTSGISKTLIKAYVTGIIIGIKKFHQRTIFTVDDGSGILDCVLWCSKPALWSKISELKKGNVELTNDMEKFSSSVLSRLEMYETDQDANYSHGDVLSCLGNVKFIRGKLQLDIQYHNKLVDVDAESFWMLDVLATAESKNTILNE